MRCRTSYGRLLPSPPPRPSGPAPCQSLRKHCKYGTHIRSEGFPCRVCDAVGLHKPCAEHGNLSYRVDTCRKLSRSRLFDSRVAGGRVLPCFWLVSAPLAHIQNATHVFAIYMPGNSSTTTRTYLVCGHGACLNPSLSVSLTQHPTTRMAGDGRRKVPCGHRHGPGRSPRTTTDSCTAGSIRRRPKLAQARVQGLYITVSRSAQVVVLCSGLLTGCVVHVACRLSNVLLGWTGGIAHDRKHSQCRQASHRESENTRPSRDGAGNGRR